MSQRTELARIRVDDTTSATRGQVRWAPGKSLWLTAHAGVAVVGGALTFAFDALLVFLLTTAITLCLGHSLGMHRRLIHGSYQCPRWLELFFVHLGTLVGMAGPIGMMRTHDVRDWAQRQGACHDYLRHGRGFWQDGWWQLHCELHLDHPPTFTPEPRVANDRVLQLMERHWMLQQVPLALLLFAGGGVAWVVWGISARVMVSVVGHWLVGYYAHNIGERDTEVRGAAAQGHNVRWAAWVTMGECWHNNHHAWPGSAILGVYDDQPDPGWRVLNALHNLGLVWDIVLPDDLPTRRQLVPLTERARRGQGNKGPSPCPVLGLFN